MDPDAYYFIESVAVAGLFIAASYQQEIGAFQVKDVNEIGRKWNLKEIKDQPNKDVYSIFNAQSNQYLSVTGSSVTLSSQPYPWFVPHVDGITDGPFRIKQYLSTGGSLTVPVNASGPGSLAIRAYSQTDQYQWWTFAFAGKVPHSTT